jgi:hypothetical protein
MQSAANAEKMKKLKNEISAIKQANREHRNSRRAYDLYAQRGMAEGHAVQDWLEAQKPR